MANTTTKNGFAARTEEERLMQHRWHGWASPVGLGLGLLSVGGFWALFTLGLNTLASTPY